MKLRQTAAYLLHVAEHVHSHSEVTFSLFAVQSVDKVGRVILIRFLISDNSKSG